MEGQALVVRVARLATGFVFLFMIAPATTIATLRVERVEKDDDEWRGDVAHAVQIRRQKWRRRSRGHTGDDAVPY